jgi:hypothetical protein
MLMTAESNCSSTIARNGQTMMIVLDQGERRASVRSFWRGRAMDASGRKRIMVGEFQQ